LISTLWVTYKETLLSPYEGQIARKRDEQDDAEERARWFGLFGTGERVELRDLEPSPLVA